MLALHERRELLARALVQFMHATSFYPVIGAELEFYLSPDNVPSLEHLATLLVERQKAENLPVLSLEKERGDGQYEIQIDHSADVLALADTLIRLPALVTDVTAALHLAALFDAKPFLEQPGSSLHFHIGLFDGNGANLLMRTGVEPYREESPLMQWAIGGMLASMQESMAIFAPTAEAFGRYVPKHDAPTTVSWGGNNRTVALRIPASSWLMEPTRHIEHRVAAANADPYLALVAILAGMHYGITEKVTPPCPKIYGDASLPMYGLEKLVGTREEAEERNARGAILSRFFTLCE